MSTRNILRSRIFSSSAYRTPGEDRTLDTRLKGTLLIPLSYGSIKVLPVGSTICLLMINRLPRA